jgi:hypothetical protein
MAMDLVGEFPSAFDFNASTELKPPAHLEGGPRPGGLFDKLFASLALFFVIVQSALRSQVSSAIH